MDKILTGTSREVTFPNGVDFAEAKLQRGTEYVPETVHFDAQEKCEHQKIGELVIMRSLICKQLLEVLEIEGVMFGLELWES